jgi:predicted AAA+ superfamily ATPase
MKRKEEQYLNDWLKNSHRKPLIIRGARQTGKSTLVRLFARNTNLKLIELNFEENYQYKEIFSTNDVKKLIKSLEIHLNTRIDCNRSLLFLDEIQAHPKAIATLRYFYENIPELAVLAAGSLLEFALDEYSFSMPVGRIEYLFMGPMTIEEYLNANNGEQLAHYLNNYSLKEAIPESIHRKALEHLRTYFLIGGMPEVIGTYL